MPPDEFDALIEEAQTEFLKVTESSFDAVAHLSAAHLPVPGTYNGTRST
jgi:hypothetical protein